MSSHREAPAISKDPVADSTDVYAFISPDRAGTVTLIANYIPLEGPDGGPNFYNFGDDVLYEIHVSNGGGVGDNITYQFRFTTEYTDPNTFLYNTGVITSLNSSSWNVRQFYSVTRVTRNGKSDELASDLACPPCNIGPSSTPSSLVRWASTSAASPVRDSGALPFFWPASCSFTWCSRPRSAWRPASWRRRGRATC